VTQFDRQTRLEAAPEEFPAFTHTLASDVTISGKLTFPSNARIDGKLSGEVKAHALLVVGPTALMQANVSAERLIVFGTLRGNVRESGAVELRSGATLIGDVEAAKLKIEEGARFEGRCTMAATTPRPAVEPIELTAVMRKQA